MEKESQNQKISPKVRKSNIVSLTSEILSNSPHYSAIIMEENFLQTAFGRIFYNYMCEEISM